MILTETGTPQTQHSGVIKMANLNQQVINGKTYNENMDGFTVVYKTEDGSLVERIQLSALACDAEALAFFAAYSDWEIVSMVRNVRPEVVAAEAILNKRRNITINTIKELVELVFGKDKHLAVLTAQDLDLPNWRKDKLNYYAVGNSEAMKAKDMAKWLVAQL